jgi:hypothetical protein
MSRGVKKKSKKVPKRGWNLRGGMIYWGLMNGKAGKVIAMMLILSQTMPMKR